MYKLPFHFNFPFPVQLNILIREDSSVLLKRKLTLGVFLMSKTRHTMYILFYVQVKHFDLRVFLRSFKGKGWLSCCQKQNTQCTYLVFRLIILIWEKTNLRTGFLMSKTIHTMYILFNVQVKHFLTFFDLRVFLRSYKGKGWLSCC